MEYIEKIKLINETKKYFEKRIEEKLNLIKVPSPLFVSINSGLQDNLTGVEKSITFNSNNQEFEIVHSLAKWKRDALYKYNFPLYSGLYTDMKAIRKDEKIDNIHSIFVEQWDYEKVIRKSDRNIDYLKYIVNEIYESLKDTYYYINKDNLYLPHNITFITSQELEDMYPRLTPKMREKVFVKERRAVFVIGIGDKLKSGIPHDLRSPDYDDWSLNGDILIYDEVIDDVVEISSMGIRVDENSLVTQLEKSNCLYKLEYPYHQNIINKKYPYTIGGGIGISRVLMLILHSSHIAEIQSSSWDNKTLRLLKNKNIL